MSLLDSTASPSGNGANGVGTSTFPSIEPKVLVDFLASVLEITLGATRDDLERTGSLLSEAQYSDTAQRCTRFASESHQAVIYVQKDAVPREEGDSPDDPSKNPIHLVPKNVC